LCPIYIQLVNGACETEEGFNILNAAVADLKKRLCDANNYQANVEEDNISLTTNIVDKEDQPYVSITVRPKGIKKKESYRNKKRRPKPLIENMKKPKDNMSKNQTKKITVSKVVY
jgi:hypothetical protein